MVTYCGGEVVELGPLEPSVIAASIRMAKPDLFDGEIARMVERADGNPLIAEMLVAAADDSPIGPPAAHSKVLAAALARQSGAARSTLFALGAAPGPLPVDLLEDVDALEGAGMVRRTADGCCELANRIFASPGLLEVGDAERRAVFERLAGLPGIGAQQRSEYLLAAGQLTRAMRDALAVASGPISRAEQASVLLVADGSAQQLHAKGEIPSSELDPLLAGAARALNDSARFAESGELLDGADHGGGPLTIAVVVERLRAALGMGDRRRAGRLLHEQRSLIDEAVGMDGVRARRLRNTLTLSSSTERELGAPADGQLDASTDAAQRAQAAIVAGLATYSVDIDVAMKWFSAAREEAASSGELASELDATRNLVSVQIALGRHGEARATARAAESTAARAGEASWAIEFRTLEVLSRFYDEVDHDDALSWLSFVRTAPVRLETRAMATAALATLLADRGASQRSQEVLGPWMQEVHLNELGPFVQALIAWGAAQRSWIVGDLAETIRIARWLTDTVPPGYPSVAGTQVVWRWAEYESGLPLTAPDPVGGLLDCAMIESAAIEMLADGRAADAAEGFIAAADSWRPILWRCALRCRWAAGHSLALIGDRDTAIDMLDGVDAELDLAGLPALRPRIRSSLRLAARPSTTSSSSPGPRGTALLTAQEHKVMLLVVEGLTSGEIARRLGIATSTVESHVRSARRKLGARTRIEAAAMVGLQAG